MTPVHPNCKIDGHYSQAQAALALGVSRKTLHRWINGYTHTYKGEKVYHAPILRTHYNKRLNKFYIFGNDINSLWEGK